MTTPFPEPPTPRFIPYKAFIPDQIADEAARDFYECIRQRRSVREFSTKPVSQTVIKQVVAAAGTAPSGANKQPWSFVAVNDPAIKHEIRIAAEEEEREFYHRRASERWLRDLAALGTDEHKPFLEDAPWLIAVFKKVRDDDGSQMYYVDESIGIAVGFLLIAAYQAGLATLTHTPSPMKFLCDILKRPSNERPFLLIPIGYPAANCTVPNIGRKELSEILTINR